MSTNSLEPMESDAPLYCANHPKEATYLRCGKCEKPICARCRVSTPMGFRCYTCANIQVLPAYAVSTDYYVKAALFGFGAAAALGVVMGLFPGFEFWAALIMGLAVPEAVSVAANQKRGPGLRSLALGAVVFGFVVSRVVLGALPNLIPLGGINQPIPSGIPALSAIPFEISQYTVLWLAMALFFSYRRLS